MNAYMPLNLRFFDPMTTESTELTPTTARAYYTKRARFEAEPALVHAQVCDQEPIPAGNGKKINFRKWDPLPKALAALVEGVTPAGTSVSMTQVESTLSQYGAYVPLSDMLVLTAVDPIVDDTVTLIGSQAGRTLDTVDREVLNGGTNKIFAPSINASTGAETEILLRADVTTLCKLTVALLDYAATKLKGVNAPKFDRDYLCIIHPHATYDIRRDPEWQKVSEYSASEQIFSGEIGRLNGVRFIESSEAKVIGPANMLGIDGYVRTTVRDAVTTSADVYPVDVFTATQATAINAAISGGAVYKMYIDGTERQVLSVTGGAAGVCKITLTGTISVSAGKTICGTGAGKDGTAIYCTTIFGRKAAATTKLDGAGLEIIIKNKNEAGGPLEQWSTIGWKAARVTTRLMELYMIRIEHSASKFGGSTKSN